MAKIAGVNCYNRLKYFSRELRRNMTKEECKLWYEYLKGLPINFYRQRIIGDYIVDFFAPSVKIVIELDGGQHFEEDNKAKDIKRDKYLQSRGLKVLRYANNDVLNNFKGVCEDIARQIGLL